jgi:hypothetical protein
MKDQALRLALDSISEQSFLMDATIPLDLWPDIRRRARAAITAIKQALAQPEQEPVAWTDMAYARLGMVRDKMHPDDVATVQRFLEGDYTSLPAQHQKPFGYLRLSTAKFVYEVDGTNPMTDKNYLPLYTTPPKCEWVGLTDEEIKPLCDENHIIYGAYTVDFIQSIEAKLKEKNT